MSVYKRKITPALKNLDFLDDKVIQLNSDLAHDVHCAIIDIEDLLVNPFQTVPAERFIHITTSFCDHDGSSDKAHDDDIYIDREISAAALYIELDAHVKSYDPNYRLSVSIQDLEVWLMQQTALLRTVRGSDFGCVEESGLTVANFKTDYGSIDYFIEFGISFGDE